jgi:hypothetical protein
LESFAVIEPFALGRNIELVKPPGGANPWRLCQVRLLRIAQLGVSYREPRFLPFLFDAADFTNAKTGLSTAVANIKGCDRLEMTNGSCRSSKFFDVDPFGYTQGIL